MAEKKDSKPKPAPSYGAFEIIFFILFLWGLINVAIKALSKNREVWLSYINSTLLNLINIYAKYVVFSIFLSIFLIVLIVIYKTRENEIRKKIMSRVLPKKDKVENETKDIVIDNPKWRLVEEHINSDDASKWRLAILEGDIVLSELLDSLNLPGEGIGEKLKSVTAGDFEHIEEAWEAHKIRNAIAHQGSDFLLTQREAKRVIELYRLVFKEFEII